VESLFARQSKLPAIARTSSTSLCNRTFASPQALVFARILPSGSASSNIVTQMSEEVAPKRLELLHELLPKAKVLALLVNPTDPAIAEPQTHEALSAARDFGIELHVLNASTEQDFDAVFAKLAELQAGGLVIGGDAFFSSHAKQLAALTLQHAMPKIYQWREFAAAGGLMSYGSDIRDTHRLAGTACSMPSAWRRMSASLALSTSAVRRVRRRIDPDRHSVRLCPDLLFSRVPAVRQLKGPAAACRA
jgi:ABC-type uncharacterized transport system substrate-binding protein